MARRSYEAMAVAWALSRMVASRPARTTRRAPAPAAPKPDAALAMIASHFALERAECEALQLAWAVEQSAEVGRAARLLSGGRGLTVELLAEIAGRDLLAATGRLRAHALLAVGCLPAGLAAAHDEVRLAPGMALLLGGHAVAPQALGIGIDPIGDADRGPVPEALAGIVRDDFLVTTPRWLSVSGLPAAEADRLAAAIARRIARPAIRADGRVLSALPAADAFTLLASARRQADLAETLLVVVHAAWIAGPLRALSARATSAVRLLLADERTVPDMPVPAGFSSRQVALDGGSDAAVAGPRPIEPAAAPPSPAIDAARRQAALDAARAMGRPFDLPGSRAPFPGAGPGPGAGAGPAARVAGPAARAGSGDGPARRAAAASPDAAGTAEGARSPATAPAVATSASASGSGSDSDSDSGASAPDPARPPVREPTPEERMARAASFVGTATPARQRAPRQDRTAPPAPPIASTEAIPAAASASGAGDPSTAAPPGHAETLPYVAVPEGTPLPELLRILREAPNPLQRTAMLRQLVDAKVRDVQFVALLRLYLKAEHPAVRGAAEYGMSCLFGPSWNRSRPITPPTQPPRSDDEPPR